MHPEVMIDLETLGNRSGAAIVSIGAVRFGDGKIFDEFYERVDAVSCERVGLHIDASTVLWWLKQNEAARREIAEGGTPIRDALLSFTAWIDSPNVRIWGNGASFDNVILAEAYRACGLKTPWKFWNDRCYRTLKNLSPDVPFAHNGTKHNALEDARAQALHAMDILAFED